MSLSNYSKQPWELIEYPSSDGKPMAENTKQARWIILLHNNLRALFQNQEVFIASDLLWYPVEGRPDISAAPDTMIVFGRPDGHRSSYKQWREEGIAPQVVFEILSPSNTPIEMAQKQHFYEKYGVQEFILIDPGSKEEDPEKIVLYSRHGEHLVMSNFPVVDWTSPTLGIRFRLEENKLSVFYPDGTPFRSFEAVTDDLSKVSQIAEAEKQRADQAEQELERLRARLKDLEE